MNRKQRRAAAKSAEYKTMTVDELAKARSMCIWGGCTATTPSQMLEPGWRCLITYQGNWTPHTLARMLTTGEGIERDCVLCPDHAEALEGLLKPLPRPIGDTHGSA